MDEASVIRFITDTFDGIHIETADDNRFFFYDPGSKIPADHRFPFVTLVTNDRYDQASNLSRPSVFRLNIGISKPTYQSLFGAQPSRPGPTGIVDTGHDFTALDQLMPHPIYGQMFWVCVLNPTKVTFQTAIQPLLAEAYNIAVRSYAKRG